MKYSRMKVLWLSVTPALYKESKIGGWIASLEIIVHQYHSCNLNLAVVFETDEDLDFKILKDGTTYYPIKRNNSILFKIRTNSNIQKKWKNIRPKILKAIEDFNPDIIHCFGSEWPYGAIVKDVKIPVVIHMQGFLNIYNMSQAMTVTKFDEFRDVIFDLMKLYRFLTSTTNRRKRERFEREVMISNRYFMGRTEWDKNIVKYFSPGSIYYYVPEAIRSDIYNAEHLWAGGDKTLRLITITQAGYLKGNEMILRTARILKEELGIQFEWRVAGNKTLFPLFERKTGIKSENVNVTLLGMIDSSQIVDELSSATFYIHPAIIDNSPNSLCEAQLIGCPVIAANVGGISQLVENEMTGYLYPYNEPYTLAFLICNLMEKKEKLQSISQREIKVAHIRHDPGTISERLYETYKAIIADFSREENLRG